MRHPFLEMLDRCVRIASERLDATDVDVASRGFVEFIARVRCEWRQLPPAEASSEGVVTYVCELPVSGGIEVDRRLAAAGGSRP